MLPDNVYKVMKWFTVIALPALITFYGVVGKVCNIPYTQEVLTIATAFDAMLGTVLGISTYNYNNKGEKENG